MPQKINKQQALASVAAFLPDAPEIKDIIEICDLYPTKSWRQWTDHLGNHIKITNNKKIVSTENVTKNNEEHIITDIYFNSPPDKISQMSDWAFISFGRDNDNQFNICFMWFLGIDGRLRLLSVLKDSWNKNQAPLICGINTLRPIVKNINIENYKAVDILRIKGPIAAKVTKSWATKWPPSDELKKKMRSYSKSLTDKIIKDCKI